MMGSKSGEVYVNEVADVLRKACLDLIRDSGMSMLDVSGRLGVSHRSVLNLLSRKEWGVEEAIVIATDLGIEVSVGTKRPKYGIFNGHHRHAGGGYCECR